METNNLNTPKDLKPKIQRRYFSNEELLNRYTVYMRKRGLSISTFQTRIYDIKTYFSFTESIKVKTLYKLNGDTLSRYLEFLKENNFTAQTQRLKLKSLKAFYAWLMQDNILDKKNEIFSGFCIHAYAAQLEATYIPKSQEKTLTPIREELLIYINKFITYYLNKGYSPDGTDIYKRELKRFINYLEERTKATTIKEITKNILAEYQFYIHNLKRVKDNEMLSISSKQKKLVVVRRFFKFLTQYDYLEKDPSAVIELPRLERGIPTAIMNERELEAFLNAPDTSRPRGLRDKAVMEVLYSTGMRNNELCHLKIEDINFDDGLIKITHAKGGIGFQRVVPIGKLACKYVKRYIEQARPKLMQEEDTDYIFLNNFGQKLRKNVLTKYMLDYRNKINIRNKITAHSFRVTCATAMLKNGADVRYIQEQLGHRSLRSTQIYTRVFPKDLKKVHSKTHPREKQNVSN